jgi:hypothetical protein
MPALGKAQNEKEGYMELIYLLNNNYFMHYA